MVFLLVFLVSFLFANNIVEVGGQIYTTVDLFERYNKQDWDKSTVIQKRQMVDDYVKRIVVEKEAVDLGFLLKPDVAIKIKNRSDMLMVNAVYEELVARPLVDKGEYGLALKNIKKEVFVSHILIGHSGSRLRETPSRNKDDAFLLAQNIQKKLVNGLDFSTLAKQHSDDLSVINNNGVLGWIGWGRTVPDFQVAVFNLSVGDISAPILTDFGYHVVSLDSIRSSGLDSLSIDQLDFVAFNSCKGLIQNKLRPAAQQFDSLQLKKALVVFNDDAVSKLVGYIKEEEVKIKLSNKYNIDFVELLNTVVGVGVVCVYNGKGLGCKWFANELSKIPFSRRPRLTDFPSIVSAFQTILLQDNARVLGERVGVKNTYYYKKIVSDMVNSLLYDSFFKWVVNTANKPDTLDVKNYYNANLTTKYKEPEKVVVREIRVGSKELADSLFLELEYGSSFIELATNYSKSNPHKGGLLQPFERGKYNSMGEVAFLLKEGEFSGVVENLDRSYSIIFVESFVPEEVSPLSKVFVRIETLLIKKSQDAAKVDVVKGLYKKYGVSVLLGLGDV